MRHVPIALFYEQNPHIDSFLHRSWDSGGEKWCYGQSYLLCAAVFLSLGGRGGASTHLHVVRISHVRDQGWFHGVQQALGHLGSQTDFVQEAIHYCEAGFPEGLRAAVAIQVGFTILIMGRSTEANAEYSYSMQRRNRKCIAFYWRNH